MVKLERDPKSGSWASRKVIPADVRAAYGQANEVKRWPAALKPAEAKFEQRAWLDEVEAKIERLRKVATAAPIRLSRREVAMWAGQWYRQQTEVFSENPGDALGWEATLDGLVPDKAHALPPNEVYEGPWVRQTFVVEGIDALLSAQGLVLEDASREAVLDEAHNLLWDLCRLMIRRAAGDYRPDKALARLPEWNPEPAPVATPAKPERTVGDLIAAYEADRKEHWTQSTANSYQPVFRLLKDTLGEGRDIRSVNREVAREVFEMIKGLPRSLGKHPDLKDLPVPAAVAAARTLGLPTISPKSINDTYVALSRAMFAWALREEWVTSNPFSSLRVRDDVAASEKRDAFTVEQVKVVFGGAPWSTGDTAPSGKPSLYWAPLIGLYHGLRVGEPCGMLLEEVMERDGVPVFRIRHNHLRRVKNEPTVRYVPIHPELIRLGFLDYVRERRKAGGEQLFPEATRDANGHYGDHVTDWFRRLLASRGLRDQGVVGGKLTLHSLRHTFEDGLREAGIWGSLEGAVLSGRKRGNDPTAADYGNGYGMGRLLQHLEKVTYPGVAVPRPTRALAA